MRVIPFRSRDRVDLYDFDRADDPVHSIAVVAPYESLDAHPSDLGVAYADRCELVRLDRDGAVTSRVRISTAPGSPGGGHVSCAFSYDGDQVWVFSPDAMLDRGEDRILVIDDATGTVVAEHLTRTAGHGASFTPHPDGSMFVEIGEGQDGVPVLRCRLDGGIIAVHDYGWIDRVFCGLSPDGQMFMTTDHQGGTNALFHRYDGSIVCQVELDAFTGMGGDDEEAMIEWVGGFLDRQTAVVVLSGYDEDADEDWHEHYLVSPFTGKVLGRWAVEVNDPHDVDLLGDGTWLHRRPDRFERVRADRSATAL
ncbi:TolB family protein [Catellatospora aurea]|uniref:TolB family protein n=1 Tax=Catellatospora aurea TaxID=1337874 RepID=A0ABW2GSX6_9ACTN